MSHKEAPKSTVWRVFSAVELPDFTRAQLRDHIERLRRDVPEVAASWSRVESIHLTLKFFGHVPVDRVATISAAAARAVRDLGPFEIRVGGTGVFPRPSRPQVLWIGVDDSTGKLLSLQQRFDEECARLGFGKEDRAFKPHLTIARIRKPEGSKHLADAHLRIQFKPVEINVTQLIVFRSELSPKGSKYTPVSRHELPR